MIVLFGFTFKSYIIFFPSLVETAALNNSKDRREKARAKQSKARCIQRLSSVKKFAIYLEQKTLRRPNEHCIFNDVQP